MKELQLETKTKIQMNSEENGVAMKPCHAEFISASGPQILNQVQDDKANLLTSIIKHKNLAFAGVFVFFVAGFFALSSWHASQAQAAVAFDASSESHTGTTGSISQSTFSWTHTPVGTPAGVLIYIWNDGTTAVTTSVTYGGVDVPATTNGLAVDTAGETGRMRAYFLGSGIPTGAQTVTVNRTSNTTEVWAVAITVTASGPTEVNEAGIVLDQEDGTLAVKSVDDGSPGTNSLRFAGAYSGLASPPAAGTGSTVLQTFDTGNFVGAVARENTAGQGARDVGFSSGTSDDRAVVYLAVREKPKITISGVCKAYDQSTNCTNTAGTIKVAVNGVIDSTNTQADESGGGTGNWSIANFPAPNSGDIITVFLDGAASNTDRTVAVTKYNGTGDITGIKLYKETVTIGSNQNNTITTLNMAVLTYSGGTVASDTDILFRTNLSGETCNGASISITGFCADAGNISTRDRLYIDSGDDFSPTTDVAAASFQVDGSMGIDIGYSGVVTGSGTSTTCDGGTNQMPLCVTGTYGSYATKFTGSSATTVRAGNYNNLYLLPSANSVNFTLTSGTFNVSYVTFGNGTNTGVIIDASVNNPNFTLTAADSTVTIAANTELKAGSGTWSLGGTGVGLVVNGTFTANTSTFVYTNSTSATAAAATYYNLTFTPSSGTPTYSIGDSWLASYDSTATQVEAIGVDTTNNVVYTGEYNTGIIRRCAMSTGCDAPGDWTVSYDTAELRIYDIVFDATNGVLYAGGAGVSGNIFRCAINTTGSCDDSSDWTSIALASTNYTLTIDPVSGKMWMLGTNGSAVASYCTLSSCTSAGNFTSYTPPDTFTQATLDTANQVIYASGGTGVVYRCAIASTACDANADWTTALDPTDTSTYSVEYDSNLAAVFVSGSTNIYSCLTSTTCAGTGWSAGYSLATKLNKLASDPSGGAIYGGSTSSTGTIYKCVTSSNCDASGDWTLSSDTSESYFNSAYVDPNTHTVWFGSGGGAITYRGTSSVTVSNNLTISANATLTANGATLTIGGNFSNSGTFSAGSGTVVFNNSGNTSTITGSNTFNNFTVATAGKTVNFTAGTTTTINGLLTVTGASGNLVHFNSSTGSSVWTINHQGTESITYLDVKWGACHASSTDITMGTGSTVDGNSGACWIPPFAGITVSGHVYSGQGSGALVSKTIVLKVNGADACSGVCSAVTDGTGAYSISTVDANVGNVITAYISGATENATTVNVSAGTTLSDLDLYQNTLIVRYGTGSSITNTNLDQFDDGNNSNNGDVIFTVTSGNLTLNDGAELLVWSGKTFAPGGTVTTSPDNSATTIDGDVVIQSTATLNMGSNALSIGGSFTNSGTLTVSSGQTTTFTATTTGQTIDNGTGNFYNISFNGSGGGWSFSDASNTVGNNITMTAGTLSGTTSLSITGSNMSGTNGVVNLTGGTLTLVGAGSFGDDADWTVNNVTFQGVGENGSGTGSVTVTGVMTISGGANFSSGNKLWILSATGTPLVATGAFTAAGGSTFRFTGNGATNIAGSSNGAASITYAALQIRPAGATAHTLGTAAGQTINATSLSVGDGTNAGATGATNNPAMNISGLLSIAGGATYTTGTGILTLSSSGTPINRIGTFTATTGNTTLYTSISGVDGLANAAMTGSNAFYNLTLGNSGTPTYTAGQDIDVTGDLTVSSGATFASTNNVTVNGVVGGTGTINHTAGTFTHDTGSADKSFGDTTDWTFNNLTFSGSTGTSTALNASNITVNGTLTVSSGHTLAATLKTWILNGSGTPLAAGGANGTFSSASSTVSYRNATSATVTNISYNNLDFSPASGTPTYTMPSGSVTIGGNLSIGGAGNATVTGVTNDPSINVSGNVTIGSGDTFSLSDVSTNWSNIGGSWTNSGTFNANGNTVRFNGSGSFNITSGGTNGKFYDLTFASTTGTWNLQDNIYVTDVLTETSGNVSAGSATITLEGSGTPFVNSGTFTQGTSTVNYTGTSATNIAALNGASTTNAYYNLSVGDLSTDTNSVTYSLAGGTTVNNVVTVGNASATGTDTLNLGATTLTLAGAGTPFAIASGKGQLNPGTSTVAFTSTTGVAAFSNISMTAANGTPFNNLLIDGDGGGDTFAAGSGIDITANGTFTVSTGDIFSSGNNVNAKGNITGDGTIIHSAGTFTIGDNSTSINFGGATAWTFNNLTTVASSGVTATGAGGITVGGTLTINTFSSLDAGSKTWTLSGTGTPFSIAGNATFTPSTSTFNYTGAGATNVTAATYNNLGVKPGANATTHTLGTAASQTITVGGTLTIGDGTHTTAAVSANTWNPILDLNGTGTSLSIAANTTFTAPPSASFTVAGSWSNAGTFAHNSGTVTFDAASSGKTITSGGSQFNNIIFNNASGGWSPSDALVSAGDLTMTAGTLSGTQNVTVNGGDVTGNGDINMTGGTFLVDGAGNFGGNTDWDFSTLTFGDGTGTATSTTTGTGQVAVSSVLNIAANQTLDAGSKIWTLSGNGTPMVRTGNFNSNGSVFNFTGTGAKNLPAADMTGSNAFFYVGIQGGTTTAQNNLAIRFAFGIIGNGSVSLGANNLQLGDTTYAPSINVANGSSLTQTSGTTTILAPNGTTNACFGGGDGLCSGVSGNTTFGNLIIGDGTNSFTISLAAATTPTISATTMEIKANATFNAGTGSTINLTGNGTVFTPTGTFTPGTSTVNYISAATTGTTVGATTYNTVIFNTCGNTFTAAGNIIANTELNISCGTFVAPSGTLTIKNTLTNQSGFTHNGGTVLLSPQASNGNIINIAGGQGITFNNLTDTTTGSTIKFKNGNTYTIAGTLTATGTPGSPVYLFSDSAGSQWSISFSANPSLTIVGVQDSNCTSGTTVNAGELILNLGNNTGCWQFINRGGNNGNSGAGAGSGGSSGGGSSSGGGGGGTPP